LKKVLIFGNSGSGKSTLAKSLSKEYNITHLDLDVLAFKKESPMERKNIDSSMIDINKFINKHNSWVIEGGYSDLLEPLLKDANEIYFLNLSSEICQKNAKSRMFEPHKYESKDAQDKNLDMLLNWIIDYYNRSDSFSKIEHKKIFEKFTGKKIMFRTNERTTLQNARGSTST
jgi:adenylate kinase family enzyme